MSTLALNNNSTGYIIDGSVKLPITPPDVFNKAVWVVDHYYLLAYDSYYNAPVSAYTSVDGVSWTLLGLTTLTSNIKTVRWDGVKYWALGQSPSWNGHLFSSINGIDWIDITPEINANPSIKQIASNGTVTIVIINDLNNSVFCTTDGITWSDTGNQFIDIIWNGSDFIGINYLDGDLSVSSDLANWTNYYFSWSNYPGSIWGTSASNLLGNSEKTLITDGYNIHSTVTSDLNTWITTPIPSYYPYDRLSQAGNYFYAYSSYNTEILSYSTDGTTWIDSPFLIGDEWTIVEKPYIPYILPIIKYPFWKDLVSTTHTY